MSRSYGTSTSTSRNPPQFTEILYLTKKQSPRNIPNFPKKIIACPVCEGMFTTHRRLLEHKRQFHSYD